MRASQHFPGKRLGVRASVILAPRPAQGAAAAMAEAAAPADLEDTMPASTHSRKYRPAGAPPYYLGRPAHWWITAFARRGRANDADPTTLRTSTSQEKP